MKWEEYNGLHSCSEAEAVVQQTDDDEWSVFCAGCECDVRTGWSSLTGSSLEHAKAIAEKMADYSKMVSSSPIARYAREMAGRPMLRPGTTIIAKLP